MNQVAKEPDGTGFVSADITAGCVAQPSRRLDDQCRCQRVGYEAQEHPPPLFVLMGNFCVPNPGSAAAAPSVLRENFNALAAMLRGFPHIRVSPAVHTLLQRRILFEQLVYQ